jgi:hypothetical protein
MIKQNLAASILCTSQKLYVRTKMSVMSYEPHLCPIIVKAQRAPNAQATLQIVDTDTMKSF